jgi:hypothetical protein
MFRKPSLAILLPIILLWCCKNDEPEPIIEPVPLSVGSVTPTQAVEGETIVVVASNVKGKTFEKILIGSEEVTPVSVVDSTITLVVPYFSTGGKKNIAIKFSSETATLTDIFEFLSVEFIGVSDPVMPVRPSGAYDTVLVKANNLPKNGSPFDIWREQYIDGVFIDKGPDNNQFFKVTELTDKGIVLQLLADPMMYGSTVKYKFSIRYGYNEFSLDNLSFPGFFKIYKYSYDNLPENELILYKGNRNFSSLTSNGFQSQVYLNGIKLKQYYHDPIGPASDGYHSLESFAVPANLPAGEYQLTVFQMDGTTPILCDSISNTIKISDITYCPDKASYSAGEDIKINIYPYIYPYRCYSCPDEVTIRDFSGPGEYVAQVETIGWNDINSSYLMVQQPNDIPSSGLFSFEMKSPNGYIYKVKEGCTTSVININ